MCCAGGACSQKREGEPLNKNQNVKCIKLPQSGGNPPNAFQIFSVIHLNVTGLTSSVCIVEVPDLILVGRLKI